MLNKLEALYLNILRVVIIVLATVLLAVAAIGAVVAGPMLLSSFGGGEADAARLVRNDRLNDYLNRNSGSPGVATQDQAALEDRTRDADRRFKEAAANIVRYVKAKTGMAPPEAGVIDYIQTLSDRLPASLQDRYADSLLSLSKDLVQAPTGTTPVDVDQLIQWHFDQFSAAAETAMQQDATRAIEEQARRQTAVLAGTAAAGFFMMFLLLVFVFVLVKIERNLRRLPVAVERQAEA
ncbi:hypothetical protein SH203_01860 [Brevundimonas sp. SH203]|uniref:hypothetical protein n=1 Tax=Brevundimonas sp. SH203 TaxID=345167 RepID=UPI0009C93AEB|nr:hypothetical protein [Brevundimonas sp. SH203]GAW41454.1 hypothetical protein SH203_01860 [Brevundimonas sp. SH203]